MAARNRDGNLRAPSLAAGNGRAASLARPRGGARPLAAHDSGPAVIAALAPAAGTRCSMTSGATARHTGSHPSTGLAADRTIVRLRGALDFAAAPALSRVSSCDPAGLAVLIGAQRRARPLGIVVRLVAPSLPVSKRLRLTGWTANSPSVPISPPRSPGNGTSPRPGPGAASPGRLEHSP